MQQAKAPDEPTVALAATTDRASLGFAARFRAPLGSALSPRWSTAILAGLAMAAQALLLRLAGERVWVIIVTSVSLALVALARIVPRHKAVPAPASAPSSATLAMLSRHDEQGPGLSQRQRQTDALLEVIVHDMRGPVGAAVLSLEYVALELKKQASSEDLREATSDALSTLGNLSNLISQVLYVSKLESCRLTLRLEVVALRPILEEAVREAGARARMCNITLDVDAHEQVEAAVDLRLLPRALDALVAYAMRYLPDGGRVLLAATAAATEVRISVHATAPAIPAGERGHIFDKFPAAEPSGQRNPAWAPALYFCKLVVAAHHGTIAIEDVDGWPLSFVIRLPTTSGRP